MTGPAVPSTLPDASDLPSVVERARRLLDEGDVIHARLLAASAHDAARRATRFAEQVKAGQGLIDKSRRLQGEALLIETRAKMLMADQVDDLQARGLISTGGRPKKGAKKARPETVEEKDGFTTIEQVGLSRDELLAARRLRDAEAREPGRAARAIAARIAAGLNPTRANLRAAVGTASASREERGDDFYQTPEVATQSLLAVEEFGKLIWEPACGAGAISTVLEAAGHEVVLSDLRDRGTVNGDGVCQFEADFLETRGGWLRKQAGITGRADIVTNPPYESDVMNRFIRHALEVHQPRKMALLLNLNFLAGCEDEDRNWVWDFAPPARVHVFSRRLPMMHREGWEGNRASSRMNTAWFVWERVDASDLGNPHELLRLFRGPVDPDAAREMAGRFPYGRVTQIHRIDWKQVTDGGAG